MQHLLGIDVDDSLYAHWVTWYCPNFQMFRAGELSPIARERLTIVDLPDVPLEIRDTFGAYRGEWACITEKDFIDLPAAVRSEILATHEPDEVGLFCWPSTPEDEKDTALLRFMLAGQAPSQHRSVSATTWASCAPLLPAAQRLGGTFARRSGPNCFGTVMAAAGEDVELVQVQTAQFDAFLSRRASRADDADLGQPVHAHTKEDVARLCLQGSAHRSARCRRG